MRIQHPNCKQKQQQANEATQITCRHLEKLNSTMKVTIQNQSAGAPPGRWYKHSRFLQKLNQQKNESWEEFSHLGVISCIYLKIMNCQKVINAVDSNVKDGWVVSAIIKVVAKHVQTLLFLFNRQNNQSVKINYLLYGISPWSSCTAVRFSPGQETGSYIVPNECLWRNPCVW